jgi:hypothetical protein
MVNRILIAAAVMCVGDFTPIVAWALDDGDSQVWIGNAVEGQLADRWKIKVAEEFHIGEGSSHLYEEFVDIGLARNLSQWLKVGANYRHIYQARGDDWAMEERPHFNATVLWEVRGLRFQDRSRIERRIREGNDDVWRYRNRLKVDLPASWIASIAKPYVATEVFLDIDERDVSRYRLYVGFKRSIIRVVGIDLYYLRQSNHAGDAWVDYHVTGIGLAGSW